MIDVLSQLRSQLKKNADAKAKESFNRFFKEEVRYYGVKSAKVGEIGRSLFEEIKNLPKKEVWVLCEGLLKSGFCEESWIASGWVHRFSGQFAPEDFSVFKRWIDKYIDNWAKCDTFCNHSVGHFIEKYPQYLKNLKTWAKSKNRWLKRAAAVSLIIPARQGKYLKDVFEISDRLIADQDDMVQKGYGWLLKEASRKHQREVFDYVIKNKNTMPRTALRYAIEKMPSELKRLAMKKD